MNLPNEDIKETVNKEIVDKEKDAPTREVFTLINALIISQLMLKISCNNSLLFKTLNL